MYRIGEVSARTGLSTKTIRYYEQINLTPAAGRADNGYRIYAEEDIERLRFIRSARALDFPLEDIEEILAFRDRDEPPCSYVIALMARKIDEITERIRGLEHLRDELSSLHQSGLRLPEDVQMKACVCHLIQVETEKEIMEN